MSRRPASPPAPFAVPADWWSQTPADLLVALGSRPAGLSAVEAGARLAAVGPNVLGKQPKVAAWRLFLGQLRSPLVLILLFASLVSVVAREWTDAVVIMVIVLGSAGVTMRQEYSAGKAVEALRSRLSRRVTVLRDGQPQALPAEALVPGDVVRLAAGSLIPADGAALQARELYANQAVLTGETFPVAKEPGAAAADAGLAGRVGSLFMGTSIASGTGDLLVVDTGAATAYGNIASRLSQEPPETAFQKGIRQFGVMLTRVMLGLVLVVFTVDALTNQPRLEALLFAIALAVGISPELLPAIITITLSRGAREMAKQGVIVRQLAAIENLGSMDVLCTDKTGTLTEGVVHLDGALDPAGRESASVLRLAGWNAAMQTGLPNPLDQAILATLPLEPDGPAKLDEVPYDFVRRRLSVIVDLPGEGPLLVCKGALEQVLAACGSQAGAEDAPRPLDAAARRAILDRFTAWSAEGYRVLGLATRALPARARYGRDDEEAMVFSGFLRFMDPPKADARETVAALAGLGVGLKVITGDNRYVAAHVAGLVGLGAAEGQVLTGAAMAKMSDEALWHAVEHVDLFAEVDPGQKERIIRALRRMGHVVGYLGDGINDAPALREADVGISVDGAVEVAREAADLVLLEGGLDVLRAGILEGRRTFANSLKYIFTTTSANFGNMLSMAVASFFIPFLPLLAKQVLLNNFMSDLPALAIAGDRVDEEMIARPHRWSTPFIRSFMVVFGLVSAVFDFLTFGILLGPFHASPALFRTGWFVESLLTELLVALVVRTRRPFFKSRPGDWLLWSTIGVSALALALPYLGLTRWLGFVPLPPGLLLALLGLSVIYVLAAELTKRFFYGRVREA